MSLVKTFNFQLIPDPTGLLSVYETGKGVDFEIKRVYCLSRLEANSTRGYHAHKALRQVAVCLSGSCRFVLDDGKVRESVVLDSPGVGLQIESFIWREMHDFSDNCVLMVLASELYSESDYIRSYEDFLKEVGNAS
ncbi:FdtA/QdtA family cupin domain-containing protein (plasmid) [Devosia neptuniae]|uniref:FdtA/QdtA family cupin domain-containing protein n=1 Tax=Devosia neptuniae TaxID=191302 RepID=A0ABY6C6B0_9HYPH|nr:FdtA/QdtA family cupin domain-containing protein [Devosia neptuniae]UXN67835.1 FdtA/QdtA family cupin domain-containing protein [Devosia neptuniae]